MAQQVRRRHQQEGNGKRPHGARQLGSCARRFGHRGSRGAAADRKAVEEAGRQIGESDPDHFLVGIDVPTVSFRIDARQHAGVGERYQRDRETTHQHRDQVSLRYPWNHQPRQATGQRAQYPHIGTRRQVEHTHDNRCGDHGDQDARHALPSLEQPNRPGSWPINTVNAIPFM